MKLEIFYKVDQSPKSPHCARIRFRRAGKNGLTTDGLPEAMKKEIEMYFRGTRPSPAEIRKKAQGFFQTRRITLLDEWTPHAGNAQAWTEEVIPEVIPPSRPVTPPRSRARTRGNILTSGSISMAVAALLASGGTVMELGRGEDPTE